MSPPDYNFGNVKPKRLGLLVVTMSYIDIVRHFLCIQRYRTFIHPCIRCYIANGNFVNSGSLIWYNLLSFCLIVFSSNYYTDVHVLLTAHILIIYSFNAPHCIEKEK